MASIAIRSLTIEDCPDVAKLHQRAFPVSALSKLGKDAVCRYYEWQVTGPHDCLSVGAFQDTEMVGFVIAGVFHGALSGFIYKNRGFLILQVISRPWLALNPIFFDRLRLGLRILNPKQSNARLETTSPIQPKTFGILAVAVDPEVQRKGIGQLLMECSENAARKRNFTRMGLSVAPDNIQALRFYENNGWKKISNNGTWDGHMEKWITPEDQA